MRHALILPLACLVLAGPALAGPRDDLLNRYAGAAKAADPAFAGFTPARGKALHQQAFTTGQADTPSCATCHGPDPRAAGRTPTGKAIEAMAASVSPTRYNDPAKVEKWFRRNCNEVLGRECTPREKGDWLSHMLAQ